MRMLTFLAGRFVAGDTAEDAAEAVRRLNARGIKATVDFLGEECRSLESARAARDEVLKLLRLIGEHKLDSNVSVKLTQFGLNLDPRAAAENLETVLSEAQRLGNFVRVDMEGSAYTQATLDCFRAAFKTHPNVGIVVQAMLRRTKKDVADLLALGARIRLCKGAYKEPADIAFPTAEEVCRSYDELAQTLLSSGGVHAIATHDDDRIEAALRYAQEKAVGKDRFEFQMLYGLRARRWTELVAQGYTVRVYVPYGTHWLPYFCRRLRERKENVMLVLRNLFS